MLLSSYNITASSATVDMIFRRGVCLICSIRRYAGWIVCVGELRTEILTARSRLPTLKRASAHSVFALACGVC